MNTRIPDLIRPLLDTYVALIDAQLPGFIQAFYLEGSIALDAFNEHFSDIDFITVVSRPCTEKDVERLKVVHQTLEATYPRWPLQGKYIQWDGHAVAAYLSYHDRRLRFVSNANINDVTWWILKNKGITLRGREPQELDLQVDWSVLIANMKQNLNSYWASFTRKPERMAWLLTNYGIQWTVLGVLRQYYSFNESAITSKIDAGEYAFAHLPTRWHRLIQEALNIRGRIGPSLYRFRIIRAIEALSFLKFIIRFCNEQA